MPTRKNDPRHIKRRQEGATARQEARDTLGDAGQLAKLEKLGLGESKEATRLRKKLE